MRKEKTILEEILSNNELDPRKDKKNPVLLVNPRIKGHWIVKGLEKTHRIRMAPTIVADMIFPSNLGL